MFCVCLLHCQAAVQLEVLLQDFAGMEPQNAQLLNDFARVFCRIVSKHVSYISQFYHSVQHSLSVNACFFHLLLVCNLVFAAL